MEHVENIGSSYYHTLRWWRKNFLENTRYSCNYHFLIVLILINLKIVYLFVTKHDMMESILFSLSEKSWLWGLMTSSCGHGNIILIIVQLVLRRERF